MNQRRLTREQMLEQLRKLDVEADRYWAEHPDELAAQHGAEPYYGDYTAAIRRNR